MTAGQLVFPPLLALLPAPRTVAHNQDAQRRRPGVLVVAALEPHLAGIFGQHGAETQLGRLCTS